MAIDLSKKKYVEPCSTPSEMGLGGEQQS
jgi:hypothetical protein